MTCPITVRLGVYALGAADPAERMLVESHLATCQACRVELARLEPLPGLLARVPVNLLAADPPPAKRHGRAPVARITRAGNTRAPKARAPAGRWRSVAGVAAAAALGAAGGFWLAQPGASQPGPNVSPAAITLSGANPVTQVRVTVTLTGTSWGTSIRLLAWGLPLNQPCRLIVRSRTGGTEVAGSWDARSAGPVSVPASAAWRLADISSLQVATTSRNLVTVTAVRPRAHVPPSSPPNR
jgi:Putative zinc-finger